MISNDTAMALLRHGLQAAGAALITGGYIGAEDWATVSGALLSLGSTAWMIVAKRMAKPPGGAA